MITIIMGWVPIGVAAFFLFLIMWNSISRKQKSMYDASSDYADEMRRIEQEQYAKNHAPLNLKNVHVHDLQSQIYSYALEVTKELYGRSGKPIYKKRSNGMITGDYRADFQASLDKKIATTVNDICDIHNRDIFSQEFITYMAFYHPDDVCKADFAVRLEEYLEHPQDKTRLESIIGGEDITSGYLEEPMRLADCYQTTDDDIKAVKKYAQDFSDSYFEEFGKKIYERDNIHTEKYKRFFLIIKTRIESMVFNSTKTEYNVAFWEYIDSCHPAALPEDFYDVVAAYCYPKLREYLENKKAGRIVEEKPEDKPVDKPSEPASTYGHKTEHGIFEDDVFYRGVWCGKEIRFIKKYSGHAFTHDEAAKLLSGEQITFEGYYKNESVMFVGKLAVQEYKGHKFVGFKPNKIFTEYGSRIPQSHVHIDVSNPCLPLHPECITKECYEVIKTHKCLTYHELARELPEWKKLKKVIPGCYIIYNQRTQKYYVGQAGNLFRRLQEHIDCKGAGGERIDYEMSLGDPVLIRWIPIFDAGYRDLNEMERDLIAAYDSYNNGYNLTRGNGG